MLAQERRRLVFASSPDPRLGSLVASRFAVAGRAARDRGLPGLERADVDAGSVHALVEHWHRIGVTGVVAYNDDIAALVVGAAIRLGLSVPQDLSVVGHDDSPLAQLIVLPDHRPRRRRGPRPVLRAARAQRGLGRAAPRRDSAPQLSLIRRESA
ncbi:substrate-binding domain-containing protein [Rathayibacter oskolensis]|nr:substrate-binding domain-containing protein [Rathayibacter oskolensis]WKK73200.1 substrate-binding domain-containing protein [Rathayibacter oskolensis]